MAQVLPLTKLRESVHGRGFELLAVLLVGAGKFVFGDWLHVDFYYVTGSCLLLIVYVIIRYRYSPSVLQRWGLSDVGLKPALKLTAPFAVAGFGFCILYAIFAGTALVNWNFFYVMLLYPFWGTIQQFLIVALLADNVVALSDERIPEPVAVVGAALLFSAVHIPEFPLVAATFGLGLVTTSVFFRTRNLWPAGLLHGWFATMFYYLVMGIDPLRPLVQSITGS